MCPNESNYRTDGSKSTASVSPAVVRLFYRLDNIYCERYISMVVEVVGTAEFEQWFHGLANKEEAAVVRAVDILEQKGITLGFPNSSAIESAKSIALRELRIQSCCHPLRLFYVFDRVRRAVLLIGGDKTGDNRFYEKVIPMGQKIYRQYFI